MLVVREHVLSRHRLPAFYRYSLTALWLTPIGILTLVAVLETGLLRAAANPRFLIPAALMCLPALYVWQEGVDVLASGIRSRVHLPRFYPFQQLDSWQYDARPERHVLTIWDAEQRKVLECRGGHLSDLPVLITALDEHVPRCGNRGPQRGPQRGSL